MMPIFDMGANVRYFHTVPTHIHTMMDLICSSHTDKHPARTQRQALAQRRYV